jgi:hypothetical protein
MRTDTGMDHSIIIEAPVYRPFRSYSPPVAAPFQPRSSTLSIAELKAAPAAWAIVLSHAPNFASVVESGDAKPYLSTMNLESFIVFGDVSQEVIAAIDAELVRLPRSTWPAP